MKQAPTAAKETRGGHLNSLLSVRLPPSSMQAKTRMSLLARWQAQRGTHRESALRPRADDPDRQTFVRKDAPLMSTDSDDFAAGVAPLVLAHPMFGRCRAAGSPSSFKLTPCLPLDEVQLSDRSDADRNMGCLLYTSPSPRD